MKKFGFILGVLTAVTLLVGTDAQAQIKRYKGKIVFTQKKIPSVAKELPKFLRKNATTVLKAEKGGSKWLFHFYAVLRKTPPSDVINIVFYEYRGGRFKYVNAENLKIKGGGGGLIAVISKYKVYTVLGFKKGGRYQMRLAMKNARGNEVVYAKSRVIRLK